MVNKPMTLKGVLQFIHEASAFRRIGEVLVSVLEPEKLAKLIADKSGELSFSAGELRELSITLSKVAEAIEDKENGGA